MQSRAVVCVGTGGVLHRLDSQPPLTIRRVRSDEFGTCALCLVGTAAGPLDGDDLDLALAIDDGAQATLVATGASIAQGGASRYRTSVSVGDDAALDGRPGPLIISAGSHVDVALDIELAATASLAWRETLVLGRSGQPPGTATLRWDVIRDGRPVLRQLVDLRDAAWRGVLDRRRVLASALLSGVDVAAVTMVSSPDAVAARLDDRTALVTVLADDAASAQHDLDALCAAQLRTPADQPS